MYQWDEIKHIPLEDFKLEHYTLMQFTGLKDKNGNEIYEGDIIRGETRNFEVIFCDGMFTTDVGRYLLNGEYEKIGNIYENHELLSGSERIINTKLI